jgi:HSP20 family molecular chaperone IbpA
MSRDGCPRHEDTSGCVFLPSFQQETAPVIDYFSGTSPVRYSHCSPVFTETRFPSVDPFETAHAIVVSAEVPGTRVENLDTTLSDDTLILQTPAHAENEETAAYIHPNAPWCGSFFRQIGLGFMPYEGATAANSADGALQVIITKPRTAPAVLQIINIKKT